MFGLFQPSERKLHRQITRQVKRRDRARRNKRNFFLMVLLLAIGVFFYTKQLGTTTGVDINTSSYQAGESEALKKVDINSQIKIIPTDLALNNDEEIKILKTKSKANKNREKNVIKKEGTLRGSENKYVAKSVHKTVVESDSISGESNTDLVKIELNTKNLQNLETLYLHELDTIIQDQNPN